MIFLPFAQVAATETAAAATTADLKMRKLAQVVEPVELWRRADALEASAANLQRILRAMANTRRA